MLAMKLCTRQIKRPRTTSSTTTTIITTAEQLAAVQATALESSQVSLVLVPVPVQHRRHRQNSLSKAHRVRLSKTCNLVCRLPRTLINNDKDHRHRVAVNRRHIQATLTIRAVARRPSAKSEHRIDKFHKKLQITEVLVSLDRSNRTASV